MHRRPRPSISRMGGWRSGATRFLAFAAFAVVSCRAPSGVVSGPAGAPIAPLPTIDPRHADNVVDRAVVARLREDGVEPSDAEPAEICRRMAVDLIGRIPTLEELHQCVKRSPGEMADAFMAMPEYVVTQKRF